MTHKVDQLPRTHEEALPRRAPPPPPHLHTMPAENKSAGPVRCVVQQSVNPHQTSHLTASRGYEQLREYCTGSRDS